MESSAKQQLGQGNADGGESAPSRPRKALTIGAVAKILSQDFDDISISKIRYLEDQGLLSPRRTQGGYRLYSQADVERLRAILRMQRDEFLPLRVIRQELARGELGSRNRAPLRSEQRAASIAQGPARRLDRDELAEESGASDDLVRELEDFGLLARGAGARDGRPYDETDLEIARAAAELARYGVAARNLRIFRTSADREAALLGQLVGAALRSRSESRRQEALEHLESLAGVCGRLNHLLLVRELRQLRGEA